MSTKKDNIILVRIVSVVCIALSVLTSLLISINSYSAVGLQVDFSRVALSLASYLPHILFFSYIFRNKEERKKGNLLGIFFVLSAIYMAFSIFISIRTMILVINEAGPQPMIIVRNALDIVGGFFNLVTSLMLAIDSFRNFQFATVSFVITIVKLAKGGLGLLVSFVNMAIEARRIWFIPQRSIATGLSLLSKILSVVFLLVLVLLYKDIVANKKETSQEPQTVNE